MNREEFLAALGEELKNVGKEERDEALKFYDEFLDEAGPDAEERVIAELGTPHRVANIIRANLGLTGIAGVKAGAASEQPEPQPELTLDGPDSRPTDREKAEASPAQANEAPKAEPASRQDPPRLQPELTLDGPDWAAQQRAEEAARSLNEQAAEVLHGEAAQHAGPQPAPGRDQGPAQNTGGPAYTRPPAAPDAQPYDYSQNTTRRGYSRSNTNILWIVILVLTFPIWIGLIGGLFGLMMGLIGGLFGLAVGGIGSIVGGALSIVRAILDLVVHPLNSVVDIGLGLVAIAVGAMLITLCVWLIRTCVPTAWRWVTRFVRGLLGKVGR